MRGPTRLFSWMSLLASGVTQKAFDLNAEPAKLRDRYGRNLFGQSVLLGRRLVAAGVRLVISVDTGIRAFAAAAEAGALGLDLIVTDHHTIGSELPEADVIVHPRLPDSRYPFGDLCGAAQHDRFTLMQ